MRHLPKHFVMCVLFCLNARAQDRKVAMTFDDLPFAGSAKPSEAVAINDAILSALRQHHAPATAFVIGGWALKLPLNEREAIFREWTEGAFDLGNHTFSHPNFDDLSLAAFEEDVA
jgi:peptidoglycan/xylan/chitin deacetylase (PgdA/CDA1 family)